MNHQIIDELYRKSCTSVDHQDPKTPHSAARSRALIFSNLQSRLKWVSTRQARLQPLVITSGNTMQENGNVLPGNFWWNTISKTYVRPICGICATEPSCCAKVGSGRPRFFRSLPMDARTALPSSRKSRRSFPEIHEVDQLTSVSHCQLAVNIPLLWGWTSMIGMENPPRISHFCRRCFQSQPIQPPRYLMDSDGNQSW